MQIVLLSGFFVGMAYGLVAVGLVVIFRGSRVISFCYLQTGQFGAIAFALAWAGRGERMPLAAALLVGALASALIGGLTEFLVVRPLREASRVTVTLATFGVAGLLSAIMANEWGQYPPSAGPLIPGSGPVVGGLRIVPQDLLILGVSALVMSSLYFLYNWTAAGLRLRATAIDPYLAGQVGVNSNRASLLSWSVGGVIAGLCAILIGPVGSFGPDLVVRGLAAALVAGMGNMGAAFATGVLIGLFEAVVTYTNRTPGLVDFGLAAFIIAILLIRPNGLWPGRYGTI